MGAALLRPDGQLRGTKKKTKRNHNRARNIESSLVTLVLLGGSQAGPDGLDLKDEGENDGIRHIKYEKTPSSRQKNHLSTLLCPKSLHRL